jgi:hypothetical protein
MVIWIQLLSWMSGDLVMLFGQSVGCQHFSHISGPDKLKTVFTYIPTFEDGIVINISTKGAVPFHAFPPVL